MRHMRAGSGLLGRIPWRLRPDRNPLRRPADRMERAVLAGLLAVFVVGGPAAAVGAGHWADVAALHTARAQAAAWHRVPAHLLRAAPPASGPADPSSYLTLVSAWWIAPDGATRSGRVVVAAGTRAGATVRLWTDASGRPTGSPLQHAQVLDNAIAVATLVLVALAALLLSAAGLVRRIMDGRRLSGWEAAWAATGPQWTEHR